MVNIVSKKIKGKKYLYLVKSIRVENRIIQKTIKYIGKDRHIRKEEFECMKFSCNENDWILNDFSDQLSYQDYNKLKKYSEIFKKHLRNLDSISKIEQKKRFLSILIANSNQIEGSTLSEKDTYNYLFEDIVPKKCTKKELYMADNINKAWNYVEKNYKRFPKEEDLFILHKFVNNNIEDKKTLGNYKKIQNYMGLELTTSHLFVLERMKSLFRWIRKASNEMNDFEVAFLSHAQFELIHPFVDGNGRVGRLLLCWLLMYNGLSPLAITNKRRDEYLRALKNAQKGKLIAISKFCFKEYLNHYKTIN